jgi:DNA-binding YbaB/EbfC family protein
VEPGGQIDMQQILAAAAAMQDQLLNAQQELAEAEVLGTAGGGLVTVTVNGQGELLDVTIQADAIDPTDPAESAQSIADLVLAAYRAACGAVDDLQEQAMSPFAGLGGGGGLPGMPDLSALGGLMGGQAPQQAAGSVEPGEANAAGQSTPDPDDARPHEGDPGDAGTGKG